MDRALSSGAGDLFFFSFTAHISEHPNQQPSHKIQITMGSTEARVDYMGSSILMGVFSNADLQLQDEWKVNLCTVDTSLSEKRCAVMAAEAERPAG